MGIKKYERARSTDGQTLVRSLADSTFMTVEEAYEHCLYLMKAVFDRSGRGPVTTRQRTKRDQDDEWCMEKRLASGVLVLRRYKDGCKSFLLEMTLHRSKTEVHPAIATNKFVLRLIARPVRAPIKLANDPRTYWSSVSVSFAPGLDLFFGQPGPQLAVIRTAMKMVNRMCLQVERPVEPRDHVSSPTKTTAPPRHETPLES